MNDKLKQYGLLNYTKRVFIGLLSRLGFRYNHWLICKIKINSIIFPQIIIDEKFSVKEMTFEDFLNSSKFSESKLQVIKKRIKSGNCFSYGVFCDNDLAYYNWISLKEFYFSRDDYSMILNHDEGLNFDAFCFPEYRGNISSKTRGYFKN